MGHDGAQGVSAQTALLGRIGTEYTMASGEWLNLNGNEVIKNGGPPSGAHSDIIHPAIAWAVLFASKLCKT